MVELIKLTFRKFDANRNGELVGDELHLAMEAFSSEEYEPVLRKLDTDIDTLWSFLTTCNTDGTGTVKYDDFCFGIMSMNTEPKKRDTWEIYNLVKRTQTEMRRDLRLISERQDFIERSLNIKLDLLLTYNNIPVPRLAPLTPTR